MSRDVDDDGDGDGGDGDRTPYIAPFRSTALAAATVRMDHTAAVPVPPSLSRNVHVMRLALLKISAAPDHLI